MAKSTKKFRMLVRDSLRELLDEVNTFEDIEVIQFLEKSTGEFALIYRK